jgi:hypothetical protein
MHGPFAKGIYLSLFIGTRARAGHLKIFNNIRSKNTRHAPPVGSASLLALGLKGSQNHQHQGARELRAKCEKST